MTLFKEQDLAFHKFMCWIRNDRKIRYITIREMEYFEEQKIMREMNE